MANYVVEYDIRVIDNASKQFNALHAAARKIKAVQTRIGELNASINKLNGLLASLKKNSQITFKINTKSAVNQLTKLSAAAAEAKAALAGLPKGAMVGGAVAGKGGKSGRGSATAVSKGGKAGTSQASAAPIKQPKTSHSPSSSSMAMYGGPTSQQYRQRSGGNTRGSRGGNRGFVSNMPPSTVSPSQYGSTMVGRAPRTTRARAARPARYIGNPVLSSTSLGSSEFGALGMLKGMGLMYGMSALGSLAGQAFSDYAAYNNTMTTTRAILGAHDKSSNFSGRFKGMEKMARTIGMETKFTAPEVADATKFLAMAGMNIEDINRSMPTIANIALVADSDVGRTADLITNIMTAYKIPASNVTKMADVMTMGFTMSNTTLEEMAESYKMFASLGAANDLDFKEVTAMIGLLGDAGIKGTMAGTTIRQILANMIKPSKPQKAAWDQLGMSPMDENGKMKPIMQIFSELAEKGAVDKAFHLFRVTAAQGATALIQDQLSTNKWQKMVEEMGHSDGLTAQIAGERKNNIQGKWAQVQSAFTEVTMQGLESMEPQIKAMLDTVKDWILSPNGKDTILATFNSIMTVLKSFGEVTKLFIDFYNANSDVINLWLKWQLIIKAVLIPLRIVAGMLNMGLGFFRLASGIGQAIIGLRSFITLSGSGRFTSAISNLSTMSQGFGRGAAGGTNPAVVAATGGMLAGTASSTQSKNWALRNPRVNLQQAALRDRYEQMFMPKRVDELNAMRQIVATSDRRLASRNHWWNRQSTTNKIKMERRSALDRIRSIYNEPLERARNVKLERMRAVGSSVSAVSNARREVDAYNQRLGALNAQRQELLRQKSIIKSYHPYKINKQLAALDRKIASEQAGRANAKSILDARRDELNALRNRSADAVNNEKQVQAYMARADQARARAGYGEPALSRREKLANKWNAFKNWNANTGKGLQNWAANSPMMMGTLGMLGAGVGGYVGSYVGGGWGALLGGAAGMALPALIGAGPIGWVGAAAIGITGLVMSISQAAENAEKAMNNLRASLNTGTIYGSEFIKGDTSDMMKHYQLMYDGNLSTNDLVRLRLEMLHSIHDEENAISEEQLRRSAEAQRSSNAEEAFEQLNDTITWYQNMLGDSDAAGRRIREAYEAMMPGQKFWNVGIGGVTDYIDYTGKSHKMPVDIGEDNARVAYALAAAAFKDSANKANIDKYQDEFSKLSSSGDRAAMWAYYNRVKKERDSQLQNVPSELMPENFTYEKLSQMDPRDMASSFFARDIHARQLNPIVLMMEKAINAVDQWEAAKKSGNITVSDIQAYAFGYNTPLKSLTAYNTPEWYKQIGYDQNLKTFVDWSGVDEFGGAKSATAYDMAKSFLTEYNSMIEIFKNLPSNAQPAANNILETYRVMAENAQEFIRISENTPISGEYPEFIKRIINAQKSLISSISADNSSMSSGYAPKYQAQSTLAPVTNNTFSTPMNITVQGRLLASEKQEIMNALGPAIDQRIKQAATASTGGAKTGLFSFFS